MRFREGTEDIYVAGQVLDGNEYQLDDEPLCREVLDLGAHVGSFAMACARRGAAWVYCYEAYEPNISTLAYNAELIERLTGTRVETHFAAAWSEETLLRMPEVSKFNTAQPRVGPSGYEVLALSADYLFARHPNTTILKLDIEGAEVPFLESATDPLRTEWVIGELHLAIQFPGFPAPSEEWLRTRLGTLGFRVTRYEPHPMLSHRDTHAFFRAERCR